MSRRPSGTLIPGRYPNQARTDGPEPSAPWAMYLADDDGWFRILGLDFDAKTPGAAEAAADDATAASRLLDRYGIEHLVCASGPSGGRHIWIGLYEPAHHATVTALAQMLARTYPTLDPSPLLNKDTGCLRPPGTPHPAGDHSVQLHGTLEALTRPRATRPMLIAWMNHLRAALPDKTAPAPAPVTDLPCDENGAVHTGLPTRPLTKATQRALATTLIPGHDDHSAHAYTCLLGLARAGATLSDAQHHAQNAPGLEHYRSAPIGTQGRTRAARAPKDSAGRLNRDWTKAVRRVLGTTDRAEWQPDPEYIARRDAITEHIDRLQIRADAAAGRWSQRSGPTDRRILDTLCRLALEALTPDLDADERRLALIAGIGKTTAHRALQRLTADGWLALLQTGEGRRASRYTLDPHGHFRSPGIEVDHKCEARPPHLETPRSHQHLTTTLTQRLETQAQDAFVPGALGHQTGNTYARLTEHPETATKELALATGCSPETTERTLTRLADHRMAHQSKHTGQWKPRSRQGLRFITHRYQTGGTLADRAARYEAEQAQWAWWNAELEWLRKPRHEKQSLSRRRPAPGQPTFDGLDGGTAPIYPRTPDGRPDHHTALTYCLTTPRTAPHEQHAA